MLAAAAAAAEEEEGAATVVLPKSKKIKKTNKQVLAGTTNKKRFVLGNPLRESPHQSKGKSRKQKQRENTKMDEAKEISIRDIHYLLTV